MDGVFLAQARNLTDQQKAYAFSTYNSRKKSTSTAYILWFLFGVYYFYLGKPLKNILFWVTCLFLVGIIWWIVDAFRMSSIVDDVNAQIAHDVCAEAKFMFPEESQEPIKQLPRSRTR